MKITIDANPKEIADLVRRIQDRRYGNLAISLDGAQLAGRLQSKLIEERNRVCAKDEFNGPLE